MKILFAIALAALCMVPNARAQGTLDITKREVTDPLLKIKSLKTSFDAKDPFFQLVPGVRVDRTKKPVIFNSLWGKNGVILLEPLSTTQPAEIDFSAITTQNSGILRFEMHKHPQGDAELEVRKGGQTVKKRKLDSSTWEYMQVDFNKEPVVLVLKANGWNYEFGFVRYVFETLPTQKPALHP